MHQTSSREGLMLIDTIWDARQNHGLRLDDYKQYRRFCTKRIQTLRNSCGISQKQKGIKYEAKLPGKDFSITSISEILVIVFATERYWSYAMDLKEQAKLLDFPSSNQKRRHMLKKCKLAQRSASFLQHVAETLFSQRETAEAAPSIKYDTLNTVRITATDILEIRAYVHSLCGMNQYENHLWAEALDHLSNASMRYQERENLALKMGNTIQVAKCQAACSALDPYIRYCRYSLAKEGHDVNALVSLIGESNKSFSQNRDGGSGEDLLQRELNQMLEAIVEKQDDNSSMDNIVNSVPFASGEIHISNRTVGSLFAQAKDLSHSIPLLGEYRTKLVAMHAMVSALSRAEQKSRDDLRSHEEAARKVNSAGLIGNSARNALSKTLSYSCYAHRVAIIRRAFLLLENAEFERKTKQGAGYGFEEIKPTPFKKLHGDKIRLLDKIIQTFREIMSVPIIQEDRETLSRVSISIAQTTARRSNEAGELLASLGKWKEAMAMFQVGLDALNLGGPNRTAKEVIETIWPPSVPTLTIQEVVDLKSSLQGRRAWVSAQMQLSVDSGNRHILPLSHGLFSMEIATISRLANPIVSTKASPLPVPSKPIFFDLAYSEIEMPEMEAYNQMNLKQRSDMPTQNKKGPILSPNKLKKPVAKGENSIQNEKNEKPSISGWLSGLWGRS
jgi:signal recognition particle subunit SRP68